MMHWRSRLLALLLGALAVLAFAPFSWAPLALLSLTGLFWLWLTAADTPREGFWLGFWYGMGLYGFGASWLFSSLYVHGHAPLPFGIAGTVLWVVFLSLFPALAGVLARWLFRSERPVASLLVVFPAAWTLSELLKQTLFGGFPVLQMGVSHVLTWLDGYAPLLGVLGVSWALAQSAAALVWMIWQGAWLGGGLLFALVWALGGQLGQIQWTTPAGQPVRIALLQGNIPQDEKWEPENLNATLFRYVAMTRQSLGADVIVWPETAIPAFWDLVRDRQLKRFLTQALMLEKAILVGVPIRDEHKRIYNALINIGTLPPRIYRKYHLVPIGEYYPLSDWLRPLFALLNIPFDQFSAGPYPPKVEKVASQPVGMAICFEEQFGEELARQLPQARYFITVSNDAWFDHTLEPAQTLQQVQMRARELGRPFARATNTGHTALIDALGRIVKRLPPYQKGILQGEIQPHEGMTPFARWRLWPVTILLLMLIAGWGYFKWRKRWA